MKLTLLYLRIIITMAIIALGQTVYAQLCNPLTLPNGAVAGAFDIDGNITSGCSPLTIKLKNKTGSSDVHYLFDYQGQTASQLDWTGKRDSIDIGFASNQARVYTILQYGKKGGQDFFACKTVTVRPNNKPIFSYNSCNNNTLELNIPSNSINSFDFYEIKIGNSFSQTVNKNQLPITINKNIVFPNTLQVNGFFNNNSLNCAVAPIINLPFQTPALFPNGYDDPNKVNINSIEIIDGGKVKIDFNGALSPQGYTLFRKKQTDPQTSYIEVRNKVMPGEIIMDLPDSTLSYCFYFHRVNSCGTDDSPEVCTFPITDSQILENQNQIIWGAYPSQITPFDNRQFGRYLDKELKIIKSEGGIVNKYLGNFSQFMYSDFFSDCKKKVCYQLEMNLTGQLYYYKFQGKSISNKLCVDRQKFKPPAITDLDISVNENQKIDLKYTDNTGWQLQKEVYYLHKIENNIPIKIDSTQTYEFKDIEFNNIKSEKFCTKINYKDDCGSISELSPEVCNVLLLKTIDDELDWTINSPFSNSNIVNYEIETFDENTGVASVLSTSAGTSSYKTDLSPYETEAKFKIKITSVSGKVSYSNLVTIPIEARLFIPEVFTPNEDGINPDLMLFGRKGRIVYFDIQIYDRWGSLLFQSVDKNFKWDGKIDGKFLDSGTYVFRYIAGLNDGTLINKSGILELMK